MWRLAHATPELDLNSPYAYQLICRDFAETSVVAENTTAGQRLGGFVTGYRPPSRPDVLFVWQVAVAADRRGQGIAGEMLDALAYRQFARGDVRSVETTVTPRNASSDRLFRSFAERWNATVRCEPFMSACDFPAEAGSHEDEIRYRIVPSGDVPTTKNKPPMVGSHRE